MKTFAFAGAAVLVAGLGSWIVLSGSSDDDDGRATGAEASQGRTRRGGGDGGGAAADGDLAARVAQLEGDVKALRRQLAMMQGAQAVFSGSSDDRDDGDEGVQPARIAAFDDAVRDIVLEERERERIERDERRREQWEARVEEDLDTLVAEAGLDGTQRDTISEAWSAEREQMSPLVSAARSGDRDFRDVREEIRAIREATDAEIRKQLTPEQYEKYLEARPRGPGRRQGPGGREARGDRRPQD